MSHRLHSDVPWMVVAWVILIATGASTTGLLRASVGIPGVGRAMLTGHMLSGAALGVFIVIHLLRRRQTARLWPVASIGATVALGWLASRSFAPVMVAGHAAIAAYAIVALAGMAAPSSAVANSQSPRTWKASAARLGFVLVLLQIALGALLRHHLVSIVWHVLTGGLATLAVLVPAVAITQDPFTTSAERRAARWAITSVLVQVSLGVAVLFMILVGTPGVVAWVATTVSHVVTGAVTLLAAARLARVLPTGPSAPSGRSVGILP